MSAIPKKKLCWNCDGIVARDIDNCPYCGVYIESESDQQSFWGPSYHPSKEEENQSVPSPVYTVQDKIESIDQNKEIDDNKNVLLLTQLRKDLFPLLFLMAGSLFFLFGLVLFLFSENGKFTLQWNGDYWLVYLGLGIPLLIAGWRYLQRMETDLE